MQSLIDGNRFDALIKSFAIDGDLDRSWLVGLDDGLCKAIPGGVDAFEEALFCHGPCRAESEELPTFDLHLEQGIAIADHYAIFACQGNIDEDELSGTMSLSFGTGCDSYFTFCALQFGNMLCAISADSDCLESARLIGNIKDGTAIVDLLFSDEDIIDIKAAGWC